MLRNEADMGYLDQCVQGGFANFSPTWNQNARKESVPDALIASVSDWLGAYHSRSTEERAAALQALAQELESAGGSADPAGAPRGADPAPVPASRGIPPVQDAEPSASAPQADRSSRTAPGPAPLTIRELQAPLRRLVGVGEKNLESFQRLGLNTIGDLLWYFPRRYMDYSMLKPINRLWYGETVTVLASVRDSSTRRTKRGTVTEVTVGDGSGSLLVTFFNQPWIESRLRKGQLLSLSGKIGQYLGRLTMTMPEWEFLDRQQVRTGGIVPVYSLTAGVNQNFLRRHIHNAVSRLASRLPDPLPGEILDEGHWMPLGQALHNIHFPSSWESQKNAKDRLGFEELLYLQLGILQQRRNWISGEARVYAKPPALEEFLSSLPYALTDAQQKAVREVLADLESGKPMNRLLEGDVGSGKTIVALAACLVVAIQGGQAAVLAPTGILAEQHHALIRSLAVREDKFLREEQVGLLLGSTPESEKREIRQNLASGRIGVIVGTHALLESPVEFARLDLAVIDEQHRFGVDQRAALRAKGTSPHLLVMTATPIPRSLALTIYGDLDLTLLDEMPPGRKPVTTRILLPGERERAYAFIAGQLRRGRQAFVICPRIEEGETGEAAAAVEEHKRLQESVFPEWKLGLLHGRMRSDDKDEVMRRFRFGELHILVSTSVVEVGVDIPNASVMMVEGANRFGLAQLHQFRGRVGRSRHASYCILVADSEDQTENERLRAMEETQDGFALAERDLEQRGPGEFFGTRQSGFADVDMARLLDVRLIERARDAAQKIFAQDPDLQSPEHRLMAERLAARWKPDSGEIS
ncbi:MAG: ATP-dependent DNA helicase RecG [Anaerolineales bacterium]|nr:ATP-dependent DNA helicase RecG [Anaerolineales bacterium]